MRRLTRASWCSAMFLFFIGFKVIELIERSPAYYNIDAIGWKGVVLVVVVVLGGIGLGGS